MARLLRVRCGGKPADLIRGLLPESLKMKRVRQKRLFIATMIVTVCALCLCYSYFIEPNRLVVTEETIRINGLDPAFDGLRIAVISDVHGGSNGSSAENIRHLVETTNAQN